MADHIATQIRDAAVTALTGLTTTGARVYPARVHRWSSGAVPGLAVYTNGWRTIDVAGSRGARKFGREIDLTVLAAAAVDSDADVDATLDAITLQVEAALAADVTLGGLAKDLYPVAVDTASAGPGEDRIGTATIEYRVIARTAEGAPDAAAA